MKRFLYQKLMRWWAILALCVLAVCTPSAQAGNLKVCRFDHGFDYTSCLRAAQQSGKADPSCMPDCAKRDPLSPYGDLVNAAKDPLTGEDVSGIRIDRHTKGVTPIDPSFGPCRFIDNDSDNDYFVPLNTTAEWNSFISNTPPGITLHGCAKPCSPSQNTAKALANGLAFGGGHLDINQLVDGADAAKTAPGNLNLGLGDKPDAAFYTTPYTGPLLPYAPNDTFPYWKADKPAAANDGYDKNRVTNWPQQNPAQPAQLPGWITPKTVDFTHSCYETKRFENVCRQGSYKRTNCPYTRDLCDGGWKQHPVVTTCDKNGKNCTSSGGDWYCSGWVTHTFYYGVCDWSCDVVGSVCVNDSTTWAQSTETYSQDGYSFPVNWISQDPTMHTWTEKWNLTIYTEHVNDGVGDGLCTDDNWRGKTKAVCADPRPQECNTRGTDDGTDCTLYTVDAAVSSPNGRATDAGLPSCGAAPEPTGPDYCSGGRKYNYQGQDIGTCPNGQCAPAGTAVVTASTYDASTLCAVGTPYGVAISGWRWIWACNSPDPLGYHSIQCAADIPPACGTAAGTTGRSTQPSDAELCSLGTSAGASLSADGKNWVWTCSNGSATPANCSVPAIATGGCCPYWGYCN